MFWLATLAAVASFQAPSGPAHIILIRHADKPADAANPHLSKSGVRRAAVFVSYINSDPAITKLGTPVAVYATRETNDGNGVRTEETVAPLAKSLKLPVQMPFHGKEFAALAAQIRGNKAYDGKTIVICWNHEFIPQLVAALGVSPEPPRWRGAVFDQVYVISYDGKKPSLAVTRY